MSVKSRIQELEDRSGGRGDIHVVYLLDVDKEEAARRMAEARAKMDENDVIFRVVYEDEEAKSGERG